jgi:hypothetical protein
MTESLDMSDGESRLRTAETAGYTFELPAVAFAAHMTPSALRQWVQRGHVETAQQPGTGHERRFEPGELWQVALLAELVRVGCADIGTMAEFARYPKLPWHWNGGPWFYAVWTGRRPLVGRDPDAPPPRKVFTPNAPIAGSKYLQEHELPELLANPDAWGFLIVSITRLETRVTARLQQYFEEKADRAKRDE